MLRPVARAIRASASGSRASVFGVGSTTVRPPACLKRRISSAATRSSVNRRLSRFALKCCRTQPRFARLTGSYARPLSLAAAGSANITLKSISRCSWGRVIPIASCVMAPSTVWICPAGGRGTEASACGFGPPRDAVERRHAEPPQALGHEGGDRQANHDDGHHDRRFDRSVTAVGVESEPLFEPVHWGLRVWKSL